AGGLGTNEYVRVPGQYEDVHLRAAWRELLGELATIHVRHDDVGHEQMDGPWLPIGNRQGLATITGLQHGVAVDPERLEHDVANLVFVLHHQDRLGAPQRLRRPAGLEGWNRVVDASQVDREGAAAA